MTDIEQAIKPLDPTCKPIGFWLSVRESHPAHPILTELENQFGSCFESLTKFELHNLLIYCAAKCDPGETWCIDDDGTLSHKTLKAMELVDKLDPSFQLGLARFIIEVLYSRGTAE
jgi:hypothetical protein